MNKVNTFSTEEEFVCEYCGTSHSSLFQKIICFFVEIAYRFLDFFRSISF